MAVCPIVELELPYTARSAAHRDELLDLLGSAFSWVSMPDRVFSRAAEVQAALTRHGQHRSAGTVDRLTGLIGRAGPAVVVDSGRPAA
jgi:predicted nucleic acid-binding protein